VAARELCNRAAAGDDRERRDAGHRKGLDVIAAHENDHVGLRLVEDFAEFGHPAPGLIELLGFLVRRPREHVGPMARANGCDYLSHRCPPGSGGSGGPGGPGGSDSFDQPGATPHHRSRECSDPPTYPAYLAYPTYLAYPASSST